MEKYHATVGQIQWVCFWAMVFTGGYLCPLWIISLFLDEKK